MPPAASQPVPSSSQTASSTPDWTVQAADTIESVVGSIRDKTEVPLETVARALVYGLVAGVMGLTALILVAIALVRVLEVYLPIGDVWLPDLIIGGLFTLLGLFLWSKRKPADASKR